MRQILKELVKLINKKPAISSVLWDALKDLNFTTRDGTGKITENGCIKIRGRVYHVSKILDVSNQSFGEQYLPRDFQTDEELINEEDTGEN